jgi:DNA-directed RNA polymerase specialized sigma subunit
LNGLDRTWRQAIVLYFGLEGEPINQKSIGRELGLSESRICQILKAACEQLRENLSRHVHLQEAV